MDSHCVEQKTHVVLVIGHSFVKRLKEYVFSSKQWHMNLDPSKYSVFLYGVSGLKLGDLVNEVKHFALYLNHVVIIETGSNDLCSNDIQPSQFTVELIALARELVDEYGVSGVWFCQILYRVVSSCPPRFSIRDDYNKVVKTTNNIMARRCKSQQGIHFWRHDVLHGRRWFRHLAPDGVHIAPESINKYFHSIRGVILHSKKANTQN